MTVKRRLRTVVAVILAILFLSPAVALAFPMGGGTGGECPIKTVIKMYLGITDEQEAAMEQLKDDTKAAVEPFKDQLRDVEIIETLLAETVDTELAKSEFDAILTARNQIADIGFAAALEGAQILTGEQRTKILKWVNFFIDFRNYIRDYPGWEEIREEYENEIKPILDEMREERREENDFLNLTDEQKAAFEELEEASRALIEPLAEQLKPLVYQLPDTLLAEVIDTDEANSLYAQITDLGNQLYDIIIDTAIEGVQILTPEQRQAILQKKLERDAKIQMWRDFRENFFPH